MLLYGESDQTIKHLKVYLTLWDVPRTEMNETMTSSDDSSLDLLFRNSWFYFCVSIVALVFFVGGLLTAQYYQPRRITLQSFLDTDVPAWLNSVRQHPEKMSLGDPNAPVTVVEYMDVECPFCKRYSDRVFPKIVKDYVRSGKVYYRIRHFPLSRAHPHALKGGVAAECAAEQGKFWAFKTVALNNRAFLSNKMILALGRIIDLPDPAKFRRCVRSNKYLNEVKDDYRRGRRKGVSGTPTVFVQGESVTGVRPYSEYRKKIEKALKSKRGSNSEGNT